MTQSPSSGVTTFIAEGDTLVSLGNDPSLVLAARRIPEGAYTTLRTYGGHRVLRLRDHVARLVESSRLQGRTAILDEALVRRHLARAVRSTGHAESRIRVTFSSPQLFISVEAFQSPAPSAYEDGVACVTVPVRRTNPLAKDTRFIGEAARIHEALPAGVHEGLLVSEDGAILEGLSSNFFGVVSGALRTEIQRALGGVTRGLVLTVAEGVLPLRPVAVQREEQGVLAEAFLTSVSRGILPVAGIDGRPVGSGRPGPVTRELMRRFDDRVESEALSLFDPPA